MKLKVIFTGVVVLGMITIAARVISNTYTVRDTDWIRDNGTELESYSRTWFSGTIPDAPLPKSKYGFCVNKDEVCVILGRNPWFTRGVAFSRTGTRPRGWGASEGAVERWECIRTNWYSWQTRHISP